MNKFNYVVAAPWPDGGGSLCVYAYHGQVQYGTQASAEGFLKYVQEQIKAEEDKGNRYTFEPRSTDYRIYKIGIELER